MIRKTAVFAQVVLLAAVSLAADTNNGGEQKFEAPSLTGKPSKLDDKKTRLIQASLRGKHGLNSNRKLPVNQDKRDLQGEFPGYVPPPPPPGMYPPDPYQEPYMNMPPPPEMPPPEYYAPGKGKGEGKGDGKGKGGK